MPQRSPRNARSNQQEIAIMATIDNKGTALITGASTGIGAIYADRLAQRGYDLILVARNRERLNEVAKKVTDKAGIGAAAPLLGSDIAQMADLITLNIGTLTRLVYAAVPGFVQRGKGTIVNIASIAAIAPELLNGVYGASKAFVLTLSRSLQHELSDKGVRVQAVLPGAIATEFWDLAGMPIKNLPPEMVMTADHLVDAALAGLDLGETVTIPSLPDAADWDAYEAARAALLPGLSRIVPAKRYSVRNANKTS